MPRVPPAGAILRGIAIRELRMPALASITAAFAIASAAAALLAARLPAQPIGTAALIVHFDQTLAGIAAMIAVFRTIARITADAGDDWMLQLVAAGASREVYVFSVVVSVAASMFIATMTGGLIFGVVTMLRAHAMDALMRVLQGVVLVPLLLVSAAAFGAAVACTVSARAAAGIAIALMIAPWIAVFLALAANGTLDTTLGYINVLHYFPPRLYMQMSVASIAYALVYIGATLGVVLFTANRRIGRRT